MWLDLVYSCLFLLGIYYLIRYRLNLKKAAEISQNALFPQTETEYSRILLPNEWREMEPITKEAKSYKSVHWGTLFAFVVLVGLLVVVLRTNRFDTSFMSIAYLFFVIINAIPHRRNLFILSDGIILDSRHYSFQQIQSYQIEEIVRWHELYGLNDRINHAFKLTILLKRRLFKSQFVVVEDREQLDKITSYLKEHGIKEEVQSSKEDVK